MVDQDNLDRLYDLAIYLGLPRGAGDPDFYDIPDEVYEEAVVYDFQDPPF